MKHSVIGVLLALVAMVATALTSSACAKKDDGSDFIGIWQVKSNPKVRLEVVKLDGSFALVNMTNSRVPLSYSAETNTLTGLIDGEPQPLKTVLSLSAGSDTVTVSVFEPSSATPAEIIEAERATK